MPAGRASNSYVNSPPGRDDLEDAVHVRRVDAVEVDRVRVRAGVDEVDAQQVALGGADHRARAPCRCTSTPGRRRRARSRSPCRSPSACTRARARAGTGAAAADRGARRGRVGPPTAGACVADHRRMPLRGMAVSRVRGELKRGRAPLGVVGEGQLRQRARPRGAARRRRAAVCASACLAKSKSRVDTKLS